MSIALETGSGNLAGSFWTAASSLLAALRARFRRREDELTFLDARMLDDIGLRPWDRNTYEFVETGALYAADGKLLSACNTEAVGVSARHDHHSPHAFDAVALSTERLGTARHGILTGRMSGTDRQWG